MQPDDQVRLQHLVDAATTAQEFVVDRTRGDLDSDEMLGHPRATAEGCQGGATGSNGAHRSEADLRCYQRGLARLGADWFKRRQAAVTLNLTQVPGVPVAVQRNIEPVLPTTISPREWVPVVGRPALALGLNMMAARPPVNCPPTADVDDATTPLAVALAARTPAIDLENPATPYLLDDSPRTPANALKPLVPSEIPTTPVPVSE